MEYRRICKSLREGDAVLVRVELCIPVGLSTDADSCYERAAAAFCEACEGRIMAAARQAREDMGKANARRRWRSWRAELSCEVRELDKHAHVKLTAILTGGGVELARDTLEDSWELEQHRTEVGDAAIGG